MWEADIMKNKFKLDIKAAQARIARHTKSINVSLKLLTGVKNKSARTTLMDKKRILKLENDSFIELKHRLDMYIE